MNKEQLSDALNDLPEDILEEADEVRKNHKTPKSSHFWWASVAACLALAIAAGVWMMGRGNSGNDLPGLPVDGVTESQVSEPLSTFVVMTPESKESEPLLPPEVTVKENPIVVSDPLKLHKLTLNEDFSMGMGFEGYQAADISELVNGNPWTENAEISKLPVFKNRISHDDQMRPVGSDFEKMEEFLREVAGKFGLDADSLVITNDVPDEETQAKIREKFEQVGEEVPDGYFAPTALIAKQNGITITVDAYMVAKLEFGPPISLPGTYSFDYNASYEDFLQGAEYLKQEYQTLIGMKDPQIDIFGGDRNIYGQQSYRLAFYERGDDLIEQILNYHFNRIEFYAGTLDLIRIYRTDLSEKVGDYPIISSREAKRLLQNGNYSTSVPYEMPGEEYIAKVELVYRDSPYDEYFMPYYRFYVELPEAGKEENGLKDYGAYYVPAVEGIYLTNMPVYEGRFNY